MQEGLTALTFAVRPAVLARYLGRLGLVLGVLTLPPLAVALYGGEHAYSLRLALVVGVLLALAVPALRAPAPEQVQVNEGLAIAALAFVIAPLVMAYPLLASGLDPLDVLLESVSAITTTGLTTIQRVSACSPTFLFTRAWLQWIGGLGIAVFSVALLMGHQVAARKLTPEEGRESPATTSKTHARRVLRAYTGLTVGGALALWAVTGEGFGALLHTLAAVSTGGMSPLDASLAGLQPPAAAWVVSGLSVLGAVPLVLYAEAAAGRPRALARDPEVRALVAALALVATAMTLALRYAAGQGWGPALAHGVLLGVSAQTTTGFSTMAVADLPELAELVLILAMATGGGVGSTAGGLKLLRVLVLLRLLQLVLRRTGMPPHAVVVPRLGGRRIEPEETERVALALLLFTAAAALSWLVFVAAGYPPLDSLFEVVSALGTVGLSSGITRPELETGLKLLLCLDMLLGRLEVLAMLVLLYPPTWLGKRAEIR